MDRIYSARKYVCMIEKALSYFDRGWSVMPCYGKKPALPSWRFLQRHKVSRSQVVAWWEKYPNAGIGIITGKVSDLVVVDVDWLKNEDGSKNISGSEDPSELMLGLKPTYTVRSGSGGFHLYYRYSPIRNSAKRIHPQIDTRGEGGFVIAPPSIHLDTGEPYTLIIDTGLEELPKEIADGLQERREINWEEVMKGSTIGSRNTTATQLAGKLICSFRRDLPVAFDLLQLWNRDRNRPPLGDEELRSCFESVLRTDMDNNRNQYGK